MPGYVLWIHLQIKQIYHSVMKAGKGGRLWNALALRAGKGCVHSAMLPCAFPAAPALALSSSVCLSVLMIHTRPQLPPLSILALPAPTKPTQATLASAKQPITVITVPGLTRNPSPGINQGLHCLTNSQLKSPVTQNNTLLANQIGDKLQDVHKRVHRALGSRTIVPTGAKI